MNDDIITLISPDGKNKIVCFKYMEECFKKEGYISSKKLYIINLLYKLFNFRILRKIQVFFTIGLRCKFFFHDPKKYLNVSLELLLTFWVVRKIVGYLIRVVCNTKVIIPPRLLLTTTTFIL